MHTRCLPFAAALTLAASLVSALAQTSVAASASGASAPRLGKPGPRPLSPSELRESASPPGDLRPEDLVKPQINIPLGRKPAPVRAPEPRVQQRSGSAAVAAGGINDASARCEAEADVQARAACRAKLAQTTRSR